MEAPESPTSVMATLPAISWSELAETDVEMQLMGLPPLPPGIVSDEQFTSWLSPRRNTRPVSVAPPAPVRTDNRFKSLLIEDVAEELEAGRLLQFEKAATSQPSQICDPPPLTRQNGYPPSVPESQRP